MPQRGAEPDTVKVWVIDVCSLRRVAARFFAIPAGLHRRARVQHRGLPSVRQSASSPGLSATRSLRHTSESWQFLIRRGDF
jgi:hypothetical protein